jgi:hypothetical protein
LKALDADIDLTKCLLRLSGLEMVYSGIDSIKKLHLNNNPGMIIRLPEKTFGLDES